MNGLLDFDASRRFLIFQYGLYVFVDESFHEDFHENVTEHIFCNLQFLGGVKVGPEVEGMKIKKERCFFGVNQNYQTELLLSNEKQSDPIQLLIALNRPTKPPF